MKLHSSSPPPSRHHHRNAPRRGWSLRRLRSRVFSWHSSWWVFVVIVAVFAFTIVRMFRHVIEMAPQ